MRHLRICTRYTRVRVICVLVPKKYVQKYIVHLDFVGLIVDGRNENTIERICARTVKMKISRRRESSCGYELRDQ